MVEIVPILANEIDDLISLSKQTFTETFEAHNTPENLQHYLNTAYHADKLLNEMQDENSKFFFAIVDGVKAGYLKINFNNAQTELQDPTAMEIERIYVLKAFHGQKLGQALMEKAKQEALAHQKAFLWLGVWEKNDRALQFYTKNGFEAFGTHDFTMGDDVQTDIMMKLKVN